MPDLDPLTLLSLQTLDRQTAQPGPLLLQLRGPRGVPPRNQRPHEFVILLAAGEIPTATQPQGLVQRFLETPVRLFAVAVLMTAVRVGRLGPDPVVTHQGLIARRVLLGIPVVVHRQRHAIGAMTLRHRPQFPHGVLPTLAQTGEALRETQTHMLPVRVRQHEVVQQVRERLALDRHPKTVHVREVRRAQPARLMHLAEEHFLGRPVLRLPLPHTTLQGASLGRPIPLWVLLLQPFQQRLGL